MTNDNHVEQQLRELLDQNQKLEAVKLCRIEFGLSLMEAKQAIDAYEQGGSLPKPVEIDPSLESELLSLLGRSEKIRAVQRYRERFGATLVASKRAVEALAKRHGVPMDDSSFGSPVIVILVGVIAVAGLAYLAWSLFNR